MVDIVQDAALAVMRGDMGERSAAKYFGVPKTTIHDRIVKLRGCKRKEDERIIRPCVDVQGKCFVITTAISASKAIKPFLAALENYCRIHDGKLLIPQRNYTHRIANTGDEKTANQYWFDKAVEKYKVEGRLRLAPHLVLLADVPILPTNSNPLSGLETMTGVSSAIVCHPRVHMRSVPNRVGEMPKLLWTTGAITEDRYSESFAGAKGQFNHCLAALVVHVGKDGRFDVRQVHFDGKKGFYDLGYHYDDKGRTAANVLSVTLGDLHAIQVSDKVADLSWRSSRSLIRSLKPKNIILHDTLDALAVNPHSRYFDKFAIHCSGKDKLFEELEYTAAMCDEIASASPGANVYCVASNHDDMLDRWLQDHRNADDLQNAIVYHETKLAILESIKVGKKITSWQYWARKLIKSDRVAVLGLSDSLMIGGVEHGYHGDKGANGARGSIRAFSRIGVKTTVGHSHSPGIVDGCYQVGACVTAKDAGYVAGSLNGWVVTHCVQYLDGHRALINIIV